jgi:argininosuccinate synthase
MNSHQYIRSFDDLDFVTQRTECVLTLFSGGLDSTYVLKELSKKNSCTVIALTVDLGDGVNREDIAALAARFGATSIIIDGQERFAQDAVLPALRCNARYMSMYPISASLSRPIICKFAVDIAKQNGCDAIIHTANQSQNSLRRINGALAQLGFKGFYGSPYEYSAVSREQKIKELENIGLDRFGARGTSGDSNLWCREFESGSLDNPENFQALEHLFDWSVVQAPTDVLETMSVTFSEGVPAALDGVHMPLVELIAQANRRVGSFGIGRFAGLEHLERGEKVLEVREAPAAYLLMDAYRHLETASLDSELLREKLSLEQLWVREAVEGRWYGNLRIAAEQFINETAKHISGVVQYKLRAGSADVCSIIATEPLYLTNRDEWEKEAARRCGSRHLRSMYQSSPTLLVDEENPSSREFSRKMMRPRLVEAK